MGDVMTGIAKQAQNVPEPAGDPPSAEAPVDWEMAFRALAVITTSGFVSSNDVSRWVEMMRDIDPRAAKVLADTFNSHRHPWMQSFMG
jgi:hypothetical protein